MGAKKASLKGELREKTQGSHEGPQCYKCCGFGHYAAVSPNKDHKLAYMVERDLEKKSVITPKEEERGTVNFQQDLEEEHLQPTELPLYVVHKVFIER